MRADRSSSPGLAPRTCATILLVEDDDDFARMLALYLRDAGYQVVTADDGKRAVDIAVDLEPDVILMDINIPGLDGLQSTALLRGSGYAGQIVALSGAAQAGDRQQALRLGCDDFVTKPVDVDELLALVSRHKGHPGGLSISAQDQQRRLQSDYQASLAAKAGELNALWRVVEDSGWGMSELKALRLLVHRLAGSAGFYGFATIALPAIKLDEQLHGCIKHGRVPLGARHEITHGYRLLADALSAQSPAGDE